MVAFQFGCFLHRFSYTARYIRIMLHVRSLVHKELISRRSRFQIIQRFNVPRQAILLNVSHDKLLVNGQSNLAATRFITLESNIGLLGDYTDTHRCLYPEGVIFRQQLAGRKTQRPLMPAKRQHRIALRVVLNKIGQRLGIYFKHLITGE